MIEFLQARPYRFTGQDVLHGERQGATLTTPRGAPCSPLLPIQGEVALSPHSWGGGAEGAGVAGPEWPVAQPDAATQLAFILPPWTPRSPSIASAKPRR